MRRLVVALIVVLGLAFAADRVALVLVQRQIADQVQQQEHLDRRPTVAMHGFPFLTQVASGRYDGGVVVLQNLPGRLRVQRLTVQLADVRLPPRDLLAGSAVAVPVKEVRGEARVAYADLAAATGIPGVRITPQGDRLELAVPITELGQTVRLRVSARIGITGGGLQITAGKAQGISLPQPIVDLALAQLTHALPLDQLPYGLRLTGVRVGPSGLDVSATAHDIVLRRPA